MALLRLLLSKLRGTPPPPFHPSLPAAANIVTETLATRTVEGQTMFFDTALPVPLMCTPSQARSTLRSPCPSRTPSGGLRDPTGLTAREGESGTNSWERRQVDAVFFFLFPFFRLSPAIATIKAPLALFVLCVWSTKKRKTVSLRTSCGSVDPYIYRGYSERNCSREEDGKSPIGRGCSFWASS